MERLLSSAQDELLAVSELRLAFGAPGAARSTARHFDCSVSLIFEGWLPHDRGFAAVPHSIDGRHRHRRLPRSRTRNAKPATHQALLVATPPRQRRRDSLSKDALSQGRRLPDEARQLARERDHHHPRLPPSPLAQLQVARIKTLLRPPGDGADPRVLADLTALKPVAHGRRVAVVVSCLDQKPARVARPGLGDPPEPEVHSEGTSPR
jgi:hypothetical protein